MGTSPPSYLKLHTDGAVTGNPGKWGIGGVFRNDKGEWILGFSHRIEHCSNLLAELLENMEGFSIAIHLHINNLNFSK